MAGIKGKSGGARKGAGRKPKEKKIATTVRLPELLYKFYIEEYGSPSIALEKLAPQNYMQKFQ